jgi:hypothetical protein
MVPFISHSLYEDGQMNQTCRGCEKNRTIETFVAATAFLYPQDIQIKIFLFFTLLGSKLSVNAPSALPGGNSPCSRWMGD